MESRVRELYSPEIRALVAGAAGVPARELEDLGGFESFVHSAEIEGRPAILKATWGGRRSPEEIGAEQHFVAHLAAHGAPVAEFLPLANGSHLVTIPAGVGAFHVTAQERLAGRILGRHEWSDSVLREWGRVAGLLHRLARDYPGTPAPLARKTWQHEHEEILELLGSEPDMQDALDELLREIAALPCEAPCFGPMHTDLHRANLHWIEGRPHVFDFDDMTEFWFISDLAIIFYYGVLNPVWSDDRQADFERLSSLVLEGYREEHELPEQAWSSLPLFLRLREQVLRAVILRSLPKSEWLESQHRYIAEATARILARAPALDLRC